MMATRRSAGRVLVVGGGIAGLGTARALHRHGIECVVAERTNGWTQSGAGMYLPANAVRALDRLGLRAPVQERGQEIRRQRFLDDDGRLLLDAPLAAVWGQTGPCLALGRRELHEVLCEGIAVRHATTVAALHDEGPRVHALFADGSSDEFDYVVGADGVHSWVRTAVVGGAGPDFLGQVSWRFLVHGFPEISTWTVWLGHGRGFLAIPLGAGRLYCYADLDVASSDPDCTDASALTGLCDRFADPVPDIVAARPAARGAVHFSPIEEVVHEPWVRGRVVLVGDAAHAMSPNMAEGAGMALEDALVLAETLASGAPLGAFEACRRRRVAFVRAQTRRREHTRRLPRAVRSGVLRFAGRRLFRRGYAPLREEP